LVSNNNRIKNISKYFEIKKLFKQIKTIKMDAAVSFRFVLYQKHLIFETETVILRGYWCPSISLSKQEAEVHKSRVIDTNTTHSPITGKH
jgi:hypothetical protein